MEYKKLSKKVNAERKRLIEEYDKDISELFDNKYRERFRALGMESIERDTKIGWRGFGVEGLND